MAFISEIKNNKAGLFAIALGICLVILGLFAYSQISVLQRGAQALTTDNLGLLNQIDLLNAEKATLEGQVSLLQGQVDTLNNEKSDLQNEISHLHEVILQNNLVYIQRAFQHLLNQQWQWTIA